MIQVILIEDETVAMESMVRILNEISEEIVINARLRSVKESIKYFTGNSKPADIIFSDVQLSDGLSFEIFKNAGVKTPVIFTTGYDKFTLLAFDNNGIDYLLKPIQKEDVSKAIWKYKNLQHHFQPNGLQESYSKLLAHVHSAGRSRLLVKRGMENILLKTEDVVLFYTEKKVVFVIDKFSKKYLLDKTLSELENELDQQLFFRANRQYIINLDYVKGFRPFEKVKLQVDLSNDELNHSIIVSQETAQAFKKWIRAS
jgi:DNA-binding LytR/AlgR family response regulator